MQRPSMFEFAGGRRAFLRLAAAHHARCLQDPVLEHPFSHPGHPEHVTRLADYWAEVFGGPPWFTASCGDHSAMLHLHAEMGAESDLGSRFAACFLGAVEDAALPEHHAFRSSMHAYIAWAVADVMAVSPPGSRVRAGRSVPRWDWDGLVPAPALT